METNYKKGFYNGNGVKIYFESKGEGQSLLLIHAGIADSRMWEREFNSLSKHFHVIRFDLPGYGLSDFTGGRFSYNNSINGLLDYLGVDKVHIVGASFGGKIAIDFVLANEDRCLSLVAISPALSGWEDSKYLQNYSEEEEKMLDENRLEEVADLNFNMWVLGDRDHADIKSSIKDLVIDMQMKSLTKPNPDDSCEEIEEEDNIYRIKNIKIPTLVMIGEYDVKDFRDMAKLISEVVPNAKRVVVKDAAHLSNLESPILFEKALLEFLNE